MAEVWIVTASAAVAGNLAHAAHLQGQPDADPRAITGAGEGGGEHHADPALFGVFNGTVWVSLAMLVFLGIVVWQGGVRAITAMLDRQIADIRKQLADAQQLRAEAEALRDEYARKIADAEASAAEMTGHAEHEAAAILAKAHTDAADLVERRGRMAEDKIAAAERAAVAEVRARAATAAAQAAATLLAERHGADADRSLVDRTIAGLGRLN